MAQDLLDRPRGGVERPSSTPGLEQDGPVPHGAMPGRKAPAHRAGIPLLRDDLDWLRTGISGWPTRKVKKKELFGLIAQARTNAERLRKLSTAEVRPLEGGTR